MSDYNGPDFKEVLTIRGTGKGDIMPIANLEMAYKAAKSMKLQLLIWARFVVSHLTELPSASPYN